MPGGMRVGRWQAGLHLADGDHRQEPYEDQKQRREQTEPTHELDVIARGGVEHLPARRQEIAVLGGRHDHEPLEPHADVDEDREQEHRPRSRPEPAEPEKLRDQHIAEDHRREAPAIGPEDPVAERVLLEGIAGIPHHEELGPVGVGDDQRGHQDQLAHVLQMRDRDQILQPAKLCAG